MWIITLEPTGRKRNMPKTIDECVSPQRTRRNSTRAETIDLQHRCRIRWRRRRRGEERRAEKWRNRARRNWLTVEWFNEQQDKRCSIPSPLPSPVPRLNSRNYLFSFEFQFESIHSTRTGIFESAWQWMRVVVTRRSTADAYHRISQPALQLCRPFLAPSSEDDDDDWDDDQAVEEDDDDDDDGDDHAFCVNQSTGWEIDKLMLARVVVVAAVRVGQIYLRVSTVWPAMKCWY